jgi:hypothetical protein
MISKLVTVAGIRSRKEAQLKKVSELPEKLTGERLPELSVNIDTVGGCRTRCVKLGGKAVEMAPLADCSLS